MSISSVSNKPNVQLPSFAAKQKKPTPDAASFDPPQTGRSDDDVWTGPGGEGGAPTEILIPTHLKGGEQK